MAECGLARGRAAVDAHHAARQAAFALRGFDARADGETSVRRVERSGHGPCTSWGGRGLFLTRLAADFVEPCATQAAAWRQEGQRFEKVGLARTVVADQHHGADVAVEPELTI